MLAAWILFACTGKTADTAACAPGRSVECACEDGARGAQVCADDGSGYADCVCDTPTLDSGAPGPGPEDSESPPVDSDPPIDSEPPVDSDLPVDTDPPPAPPAEVYLLAGQSNMVGYSQANGLPPSLQIAQEDVQIYRSGEPWWKPLEPASDYAGWTGPEVTFGRTLADALPDRQVLLIKHAVGGTDLAQYWHPGDYAGDPATGEGYRTFLSTVGAGLSELDAAGVDYRVAGMIWMQGESDTFDATWSAAYGSNLDRLIDRAREDVSAPDMPFALGQIDCPGCPAAGREQVRAAQADAADAADAIYAFDTEDLLGQPDGYHYVGVGMKVLGERFAQALLGQPLSPPPTPAVTWTGGGRADYTGDYMVGWSFSLDRPVRITALGLMDISSDGLPDAAQVALWRAGDRSRLALITVPSAIGGDTSLVGGFRYVGVDPVSLPAGDYVVAAQSFYGGERYLHSAGIEEAGAVTWIEGRHAVGAAVAYPTNVVAGGVDDAQWFGAGFLYDEE